MSFKNNDVLSFYEKLPFNIYGDLDLAINQIKKSDPLIVYPELGKIFDKHDKVKIIDFGCGGGWLVNSIAYHHGKKCQRDCPMRLPLAVSLEPLLISAGTAVD